MKNSVQATIHPAGDKTLLLLQEGIKICEDKKGENVVAYDFNGASALTDYCLICSAFNDAQLRAIAVALEKKYKELGIRGRRAVGNPESGWIILDYYAFVVHVFHRDTREFYQLEAMFKAGCRIYPDSMPDDD